MIIRIRLGKGRKLKGTQSGPIVRYEIARNDNVPSNKARHETARSGDARYETRRYQTTRYEIATPETARREKPRKNHHAALALPALLTPAAVIALVLAVWPLLADLKFTGAFPIDAGVFSHWQVWLALGCSLQCVAIVLNRYGKPKNTF